jgi:signal transduction histidine kinase
MNDAANILVVDDDETLLATTTRLLRQAGHQVSQASTGIAGLALTVAHPPDVVLLNVALPDLDGLEVCRRIRANPALSDVFVVLAAAGPIAADRQAAGHPAGADGVVPRPVGDAELLARVEAFLRLRRTELALRRQERMATVASLAVGVAHEINNPLMGIMGYAELLQESLASGTPLREYADEIVRETQRVAGLVRSLSSFTQHSGGERRWHPPASILHGIVTLVETRLRSEHVRLDVGLPVDLPDILCCAPQIRQVLLHLIANAREALAERYPAADPDKILRISADASAAAGQEQPAPHGTDADAEPLPPDARPDRPAALRGWLRLTVEDHGAGIPEALRGAVFDPFFTTKSRAEHSGLGLATSRRIVQEHGGRLTVECLEGQWTRFDVVLPVAAEPPP